MSNDNRPTFDVREFLKPWHDTIRTVYYLIAIATAAYFGLGYVLRHIVVPYWPQLDALISTVLLVLLAFTHSKACKRRLAVDDRLTRSFIVAGPTFLTALTVHAGVRCFEQPPSEPHALWGILFGVAIATVPISLMDAAICLISQLESAVVNALQGMIDTLQRMIENQRLASDYVNDDIRGIHTLLERMITKNEHTVAEDKGGPTPPVPELPPPR